MDFRITLLDSLLSYFVDTLSLRAQSLAVIPDIHTLLCLVLRIRSLAACEKELHVFGEDDKAMRSERPEPGPSRVTTLHFR